MNKFTGLLAAIFVAGFLVVKLFTAIAESIIDNAAVIGIVLFFAALPFIAYKIYAAMYFSSKKFNDIKESISGHTNNCNELNQYIEGLKRSYVNIESYNYGSSDIKDTSQYDFKRTEWNNDVRSNQIHDCSSTVCKNAHNQPIKYLCKYFAIEKTEDSLSKFEKTLNDFASVEQGKESIKSELVSILAGISDSIPFLIKEFSEKTLIKELGFETVDISDAYIPLFTFKYVSAGGNSSSECVIKLDEENLNLLIHFLNDAIKWRKSVAGQRALMTSKLRTEIKERDNFKCCSCSIGIEDEPHLLLEIDHITPLSKGGLSNIENLQTLCWKCNRTKGAKILD